MCAKGFEAETLCTLSQIIEQEMPNSKYGIFSGPSHAEEVSVGIPTAIVIASKDEGVRNLVQETFMNEKMRVYTSDDVIGVELGGALKNIIAFCAGIATEIDLANCGRVRKETCGSNSIATGNRAASCILNSFAINLQILSFRVHSVIGLPLRAFRLPQRTAPINFIISECISL